MSRNCVSCSSVQAHYLAVMGEVILYNTQKRKTKRNEFRVLLAMQIGLKACELGGGIMRVSSDCAGAGGGA